MNPTRRGAILALLCWFAGSVQADSTITVADAWIRALPPGSSVSAAFMRMANHTDEEIMLLNARSTCAGSIELHLHTHEDGVMRMRRIPHIHLPPQRETLLAPGGLHLMLFELKCPLSEGATFNLELEFDDGSSQALTVPVVKR